MAGDAGPGDALVGARFKPDPHLLAQGWEYRFVAGGPRLLETTELYEQLGFDVLAQTVPQESFADECEGCRVVALLELRMVYTRRRSQTEDRMEDLDPKAARSPLDGRLSGPKLSAEDQGRRLSGGNLYRSIPSITRT